MLNCQNFTLQIATMETACPHEPEIPLQGGEERNFHIKYVHKQPVSNTNRKVDIFQCVIESYCLIAIFT